MPAPVFTAVPSQHMVKLCKNPISSFHIVVNAFHKIRFIRGKYMLLAKCNLLINLLKTICAKTRERRF